jgi:hypothetical protein
MNFYKSLERRISILESYILEGKRDQEILNDFLGDDYYNKYQTIKNRISDPDYKDIYRLIKKDPDEVKDYIDNFKSNRDSIKAAKEGAIKLYEDSDWVVYKITSYSASKYYGKNTKWCISGNYPGHEGLGERYFNKYIKEYNLDGGYYFYINKHNPNDKYCILKKKSGSISSIWDAEDTNIGDSLYPDDVDLPYVKEVGLNTAEQEEFYDAIKRGDLESVKELFDKSIINIKNAYGVTPLIMAVSRSYEDIAKFLIKNGADVNAKDNEGSSTLLHSCFVDDSKIAELLVRSGADINVQDNFGITPLIYSCSEGYINLAKLLVKYGADINMRTKYGTALESTDDESVKQFLIENGAK